MKSALRLMTVLGIAALAGCSSSSGITAPGSGGTTSAGGSSGLGGTTTPGASTGGATSAGGITGAGGVTPSGGSGATSAGGAAGVGGVTGAGGASAKDAGAGAAGGASADAAAKGGATGTGGSTTAGGATGSGGSTVKGGATGSGGAVGGAPGTGGSTVGSTGGAVTTKPQLITSSQTAFWQAGTYTTVTTGTADITVTDTTTYQTWDGFGGTFNEMGWNVLSMLSAADRDKAIKLLFDATDGAAFVFGRIPIGASDYAMDNYTDDETAGDYTMAKFSIDRDKQKLIPYIKAALAINPNIRLWGSPWTPPTWMKDNGAFAGGNMKDDAQVLQAHALYLAKWVQGYAGESVKIEAVHPQNEPGYATNYSSCLWTAALMTKFIGTYLGPTFASQNVTAQIYLGTMSNNDSGKDGTIITTVTGDATAMKYVKGFGLQWNMLPVVSGLTSKNLEIVQSEHKCGNYPWNPGGGLPAFDANKAQNDYPYGVESWGYIRDWIKAGVNAYSAWNMVLDNIGKNLDTVRPWPQNALLTVDTSAKTLTATPAYYVFRHFSQYIAPGAKRVATSGSSPDTLAFKNPDGGIVAVMYNSGSSAKTTTLAIGTTAKVQFSIPANGFATVNYK